MKSIHPTYRNKFNNAEFQWRRQTLEDKKWSNIQRNIR